MSNEEDAAAVRGLDDQRCRVISEQDWGTLADLLDDELTTRT